MQSVELEWPLYGSNDCPHSDMNVGRKTSGLSFLTQDMCLATQLSTS